MERRWSRLLSNERIGVADLYVPLVLVVLSGWQPHLLALALDTTVLWNRYCMIHLSLVCCGRAVPLLWRVLELEHATVAFKEYQPLIRARPLAVASSWRCDAASRLWREPTMNW